jgi:hypothetical protein
MTTTTPGLAPRPTRLFPELVLALGLPILAIFVGSTLAITAYVKGFTQLPEPAAQVTHQR